tara:strand:- start:377 stop:760 length:384 start_codon:yes stop_codon:yes gene_type:complete
MKIMFNEDINFDVILSFDDKDQEFFNFNMKLAVDTTEKDLVHSILIGGFVKENLDYYPDALLDLCKLSVCVSCKEKDFLKLPCIKALLKRNGKYYFQPNQRDEMENDIVKNTVIASKTKNFERRANG